MPALQPDCKRCCGRAAASATLVPQQGCGRCRRWCCGRRRGRRNGRPLYTDAAAGPAAGLRTVQLLAPLHRHCSGASSCSA
eukprot:13456680-Alexandrium_andersonii.AAC.1